MGNTGTHRFVNFGLSRENKYLRVRALGRTFCRQIRKYCGVEQFIDRQPPCESFETIPIYKISDANINTDTVVIVIPTYDFENIVSRLLEIQPSIRKENIVKFEDFVSKGRENRYGF